MFGIMRKYINIICVRWRCLHPPLTQCHLELIPAALWPDRLWKMNEYPIREAFDEPSPTAAKLWGKSLGLKTADDEETAVCGFNVFLI